MIELPFPPAQLSGHAKGHWHGKAAITKRYRAWAHSATIAARSGAPASGDIRVIVTFYPPDNRSDRTNLPNRMKPYFDGIADALKVNDRRFVPSYHFAEPVGRDKAKVVVVIGEAA